MKRAGSVVICVVIHSMVMRGMVICQGSATACIGIMIVVCRRSADFVISEDRAKLSGDCEHDLRRHDHREYRHQKQTRPSHAVPPDSKNVLGCRPVLAKYHTLARFGWFGSRPRRFCRKATHHL